MRKSVLCVAIFIIIFLFGCQEQEELVYGNIKINNMTFWIGSFFAVESGFSSDLYYLRMDRIGPNNSLVLQYSVMELSGGDKFPDGLSYLNTATVPFDGEERCLSSISCSAPDIICFTTELDNNYIRLNYTLKRNKLIPNSSELACKPIYNNHSISEWDTPRNEG